LAEINWTRESEIWLKDIYDYIASDDAEAAARTITTYLIKPDGNIDIIGVFHGALDIERYFI